jgi:hypothetical protein
LGVRGAVVCGHWGVPMRIGTRSTLVRLALLVLAAPTLAGDLPFPRTEARADCAAHDPLRRPFFGDTHVHTAYSFDANLGGTRNTPRDAYRFAKGAELGLQPYDASGKPLRSARLSRPLDFAAVTDHSETLGEVRICRTEGLPGYDSDVCWIYRNLGPGALGPVAMRLMTQRSRYPQMCGENDRDCIAAAALAWRDIQAAAEEAYDRSAACAFTSFVGYEWTASYSLGANMHHNVIFRNEKVPAVPTSYVETASPLELFASLERDCVAGTPGCEALTIPHNSNLSGPGLMFESARITKREEAGARVDVEEARLRQRWSPLVEIAQHKGDSECLLGGDTTDEACGFEKLPYNSFSGVTRFAALNPASDQAPNRQSMVREALKKGVALQRQLGVNPLKMGIVASTDTHLGTPGLTEEDAPRGHGGAGVMGATAGLPDDIEYNPGGLAVLWAEENSRDALFAAMQRREAYGTSGTRPTVRFFGGWSYGAELCSDPQLVAKGYQGGVPMGGDLPKRPRAAKAPTFAALAVQDPGTAQKPGTPLQRIQVVKGWVDANGAVHERVVDVAGGDNGASVDEASCEPRGDGAKQLCAVWSDPDFDAKQGAFYYARVLENPTCRWSTRICRAARVDCSSANELPPHLAGCCSDVAKPTVQERAWTSPIWYEPE